MEKNKDKRTTAETEAKNDFAKTAEHLLKDIHDESLDQTRPGTETVSRTMARFAALLLVLSREADKTTRLNLDIQAKLCRLTWGLLWLTFVLLIIAAIQLFLMFK